MMEFPEKKRAVGRGRLRALAVTTFLILAALPSSAGWLQDDVPVCTDPAKQSYPRIRADGTGGAIVVWQDSRDDEIYAQRLGPEGEPLWAADGVNVSQRAGFEGDCQILPDGTGGAFASYESLVSPCSACSYVSRLAVGRIGPDGTLLWKKYVKYRQDYMYWDAVDERNATLLHDGNGGFVVVWQMAHGFECDPFCMDPPCCWGWDYYHVYAQRFDADGGMLWDTSGVMLCAGNAYQTTPQAVMIDSSIVVTWSDERDAANKPDIFAQRVDLDGNLLWGPLGLPVCGAPYSQVTPQVAGDGSGGAIVAWRDYRSGDWAKGHIYAQRLDSLGNALWTPNGVPLCTNDGKKDELGMVASGRGSAVVSWTNTVGSIPSAYAQRVDSSGSPIWGVNGLGLSAPTMKVSSLRLIPDGGGGAVFAWQQIPSYGTDNSLRSIWGTSDADVFAVGDLGTIVHYDGRSWDTQFCPVSSRLNCVWGTSPSDVFAVGDGGVILHYNGVAWSSMPSGTTANLAGVWGSSWDNVYAVGASSVILHYDGSGWSTVDYAPGANLTAIHGTSATNVIVVGNKDYRTGVVLTFDGSTWQKTERSGESERSVWVSPDNELFIGGVEAGGNYDGMVMHWDAGGWHKTRAYSGGYASYGVWGNHSHNVYAIFSDGSLLHYDGTSWVKMVVSTGAMYDVWGTFGSDVWVAGSQFTVRRFEDPDWVTKCRLVNGDLFMQKVSMSGEVEWTGVGAPAAVSLDEQNAPTMAYDPAGYALLAWQDNRLGNWDIFTRKVSLARGPLVATELQGFEAAPAEAGIRVAWELSRLANGARFVVSRARASDDSPWEAIAPAIERRNLAFSFTDAAPEPGRSCRYRVEVSDADGRRVLFETGAVVMPALPVSLYQNVPNPFNPSTTIRYYLPERCLVKLRVYDVAGRLVAGIIDGEEAPGLHAIEWRGENARGARVASGLYLCRLQAGRTSIVRKMVLLK